MNRSFVLVLILLIFLFPSCKNDDKDRIKALYEEGRYDEVLVETRDEIKETLSSDALWYKAMSLYKMGEKREAYETAMLYVLITDNDESKFYDAMRVILHSTDDYSVMVRAAEPLERNDKLQKNDLISYYAALVRTGNVKKSDEIYIKVQPLLTPYENAVMNLAAGSESTKILSSLENLYEKEGFNEDFIVCMKLAIPLFINRGESGSLEDVWHLGHGGDMKYALYIGDLMFSLGRESEAASWWKAASKEFPEEAQIRLREID